MTEEDSIHRVFVYGTLRPSDKEGNYLPATHILHGYSMFNYFNKFPYIEPADYTSFVLGNVIEVGDKDLAKLDHYEGVHNNLYHRKRVAVVKKGEKQPQEVWTYVAGDINLRVESGDWADVWA